MNEIELGPTATELRHLRALVQQVYSRIDGIENTLQEIGRQADAARAAQAELDRLLVAANARFADRAKQLDDAGRVLHREAAHLEELGTSGTPAELRDVVLLTSAILRSSVRLAKQALPPELAVLDWQNQPTVQDLLRNRWGEWLAELSEYLETALPLALVVAELDGESQIAELYRARLSKLCRRIEELLLAPASAAQNTITPETPPPMTGPAGDATPVMLLDLEIAAPGSIEQPPATTPGSPPRPGDIGEV